MTKIFMTLSALLFSALAFADANVSKPVKASQVIYTCEPINPASPIHNVILEQAPDFHYELSFITTNSSGEKMSQSATAEYYDDMTYLGYWADTLKAALEFNYPIDLNEDASFQLNDKWLPVRCKQP